MVIIRRCVSAFAVTFFVGLEKDCTDEKFVFICDNILLQTTHHSAYVAFTIKLLISFPLFQFASHTAQSLQLRPRNRSTEHYRERANFTFQVLFHFSWQRSSAVVQSSLKQTFLLIFRVMSTRISS